MQRASDDGKNMMESPPTESVKKLLSEASPSLVYNQANGPPKPLPYINHFYSCISSASGLCILMNTIRTPLHILDFNG